jgi:hypothetical protein
MILNCCCAGHFANFTKLHPLFLREFQEHMNALKLDFPRKMMKLLKFRFVLVELLAEQEFPPDDFDRLAQAILDPKLKENDISRALERHLSTVGTDSAPKSAGVIQLVKNWIWSNHEDKVAERIFTNLAPSELVKMVTLQCESITDLEFLSKLNDYTHHLPVLQRSAVEAEEIAWAYFMGVAEKSTEKLFSLAQHHQSAVRTSQFKQEVGSKVAEELKASRLRWIGDITEASRVGSLSCAIQFLYTRLFPEITLAPFRPSITLSLTSRRRDTDQVARFSILFRTPY